MARRLLVDLNGAKLGKLQDVYVDVETDRLQFATVKQGFIGRHLTFAPLAGIKVGPDELRVAVTKEQVRGRRLAQARRRGLPGVACRPAK